MVVSTAPSTTMEEVAAAGGDGPRWYQLYWSKDRDLAASFLERASASGYRAQVPLHDGDTLAFGDAQFLYLRAETVYEPLRRASSRPAGAS